MSKIVFAGIFFLAIMSPGCLYRQNKLDRLWFYTFTSQEEVKDTLITPASFIDLEPDGSYTRDFGFFDQGNWKEEDSTLILKNKNGKVVTFHLKPVFGNQLRLLTSREAILNFESQPRKFSSPSENPFSIQNNQWRIPAIKKESEQEIKNRLKNHFRFYELYLTWALNNHFESLDVNSAPSLLTVYGNGFELKPFNQLSSRWRTYFYDDEDCNKANEIIKNIFERHEIKWPITQDKFKMFISAFQQLQEQVK